MLTESNELARYRSFAWRPFAILIIVTFAAVSLLMLAMFTDVFTRGWIDDLPLTEREVLRQIESAGILVQALPLTYFGAPDHVIVKVHWNHEASTYTVSAIEIRSESLDQLIPLVRRLPHVNDVRAPLQNNNGMEILRRSLPGAKVSRNPLYSTNQRMHPSRERCSINVASQSLAAGVILAVRRFGDMTCSPLTTHRKNMVRTSHAVHGALASVSLRV